jgi:hypothetical protein
VPENVPARHLARCVLQIDRGDNVLAIEDRARAVTGDSHAHDFRDARTMRSLAAVRRRSCRSMPEIPAVLHALVQLFLKSRTRSSCSSTSILTSAER